MGQEKKCPLFRRSESLRIGKGIGYCDVDSCSATCEGDIKFCEKPETLERYLKAKIAQLKEKEKKRR